MQPFTDVVQEINSGILDLVGVAIDPVYCGQYKASNTLEGSLAHLVACDGQFSRLVACEPDGSLDVHETQSILSGAVWERGGDTFLLVGGAERLAFPQGPAQGLLLTAPWTSVQYTSISQLQEVAASGHFEFDLTETPPGSMEVMVSSGMCTIYIGETLGALDTLIGCVIAGHVVRLKCNQRFVTLVPVGSPALGAGINGFDAP